ncbi:phosphoglycolate phosphatase [Marinicellulosiphila megalodicopiae]|uniref:phosphoglycolate phosphatase n=1 Tax=Marinicellulosiphila megalodicopiae TaxID=2724896 RepID=UPI003BAE9B43
MINTLVQPKPKAIFFDLDGTLVDSSYDIYQAISKMLIDLKLKAVTLEQVQSWIGNGSRKLVQRTLAFSLEKTEQEIEVQMENAMVFFNQHYAQCSGHSTKLYEGVFDVLTILKQQNIKMCVITNKPKQFTPTVLKSMKIDVFFELVISGDTLKVKKPDPAPLNYAIDFFNLTAQDVIMVGDSSSDIDAANAANIKSVCVTYGYNHGNDPRLLPATKHIDSFNELI